ncbi:PBSX family phage terminase large subunit [Paraburkholderia sp. BR10882]|uniref:PBSX family phage terminase large subunit n=1 Tax=unclassified Paraburkholderia TaxID=2615204 RepID=UPI0034CFAFD7
MEELVKQQQQIKQPKQFRIGVFKSSSEQHLLGVVDINGNPLQGTDHNTSITEDFLPLLNSTYRFVSMRGGRGSGKSVTVAKILLIQAYTKPLKILCFREVQNSIKDSVYTSLLDLISELGLGDFYTFTLNEIRGANGSVFIFKGLSDQTVDSIKSFSGIDICWGEEAAGLTEKSLKTLIPTIRNEGSRFYFTWNPSLDTDAVYQRYVLDTRDDVKDVEVNWNHNPWFPQVLETERRADLKRLPEDEYKNIWEGTILPAQVGAVYFRELSKAFEQDRVTRVMVDPKLPVHAIWDLGWADQTAIILVQRTLSELRVVGYIESNQKTLAEYNHELRDWGVKHSANWGTMWLPHDGAHRDFKTGQSAQEIMEAFGWKVQITPNMAIDQGIRSAKQMFGVVYFDKDNTTKLLECLKRYHYKERADGSFGDPVHDQFSHGADAFRYVAVNQEALTSTNQSSTWGKPLNYKSNSVFR